MKRILLCSLSFLFLISGLKAQNFTEKVWQFYAMGDELFSENDMFTYFKMSADGTMQVLDNGVSSVGAWELSEDKKALILKSESSSDRWEIKEQKDDLLIIENLKVGTLTLKLAEDQTIDLTVSTELPEDEVEIVEPEAEPVYHSIETDYKPTKKDAKLLIGTWEARVFSGQKLPDGISIKMELTKKGEITMYVNGKAEETNTYKRSTDGKKLEIDRNSKTEYWGIKVLNAKELHIVDKNVGEIQLFKVAASSKK